MLTDKYKKILKVKEIFKKLFKKKKISSVQKFKFFLKSNYFSDNFKIINFIFCFFIFFYQKFQLLKKRFSLSTFGENNFAFKKLFPFSNFFFFYNFKKKTLSKKRIKCLLWLFIFNFFLKPFKIIDKEKIILDLIFCKKLKSIKKNNLLFFFIVKQKKFLKIIINKIIKKKKNKIEENNLSKKFLFGNKLYNVKSFLKDQGKNKKKIKNLKIKLKNSIKNFILSTSKQHECFCCKLKILFSHNILNINDFYKNQIFFVKNKNVFFFFIKYNEKNFIEKKIGSFLKNKFIFFKKQRYLLFNQKINLSQKFYDKIKNLFFNDIFFIRFCLLNNAQKKFLKINKIFMKNNYTKNYHLCFIDEISFFFLAKISKYFNLKQMDKFFISNIAMKRFFLFIIQNYLKNFFFGKKYFLKLITHRNIIQKIFLFSFELSFKVYFQLLTILIPFLPINYRFYLNLKRFDIYLIFLLIIKNNVGTFLMLKKIWLFFFHFYLFYKKIKFFNKILNYIII
jgi:hypothetical protein